MYLLLKLKGGHCGKTFFCCLASSQVFFFLQEINDAVCICGWLFCLFGYTYLFATLKCGLTFLRIYTVKIQYELKYYKLIGGLGESPNKTSSFSVFVRIRTFIHVNLCPEGFYGFIDDPVILWGSMCHR